jgi:hypothetical protein
MRDKCATDHTWPAQMMQAYSFVPVLARLQADKHLRLHGVGCYLMPVPLDSTVKLRRQLPPPIQSAANPVPPLPGLHA